MTDQKQELKAYTTGFVLSVLLTLVPFLIVIYKTLSGAALVTALAVFAVLQLLVQLIFFLHVGKGRDGKWNILAFLFMLIVVFVVVVGSIWIMYNLDYHMTPTQVENELLHDQGIKQ